MSVSPAASLQSSAKTLSCAPSPGAYTCIAAGMNIAAIPNGVVAVVSVTLASTFSGTNIDVASAIGATPAGTGIFMSALGAPITLTGSSGSGTGFGAGTATFVNLNNTLQGGWKGTYGSEGYNVIGDRASNPPYVTPNPSGASTYVWAASTTDTRALQKASSLTDRVAGTWFSQASFSIDLNFTDSQPHQLAVYCLDWDRQNRAETLSILDGSTNAVLDVRTLTNFSGGQYAVWNLTGHVILRVARVSGPNAVISGIFFGPGISAAAFVKTDSTTQGSWKSAYGKEGFSVAGDTSINPGYVAPAIGGANSGIWLASTTDVRALQKNLSSTDRVAAYWSATTSFTLNLDFNDAAAHQLALYFLDWTSSQRSATVTVQDAATGSTLDTRVISNFAQGVYLVWSLKGHVRIQLTRTGGPDVVLSGIFFGGPQGTTSTPPPTPPPTSSGFVKTDSTTMGTWKGVYGNDGYFLIADGISFPAYGIAAPSNALSWIYTSSTTDPRALQKAASSDRIAAVWYNAGSFNFSLIFSDTALHQVAIYCVDWDNRGRAQTITIRDMMTGAVVDTRTVSGFYGGKWLVWNLQGQVQIQVTRTAGPNAVVSGIFFR